MLIYYTPFLQRKQGKKAKRLKVFPNLHIIMCSEPSFSVKKYLRGSFLMAFCSFSKDNESAYTLVENKFITHYLPEADGFAVKVYLYGLYLCENRDSDFTVSSMAEILKVEEEKIREAFLFGRITTWWKFSLTSPSPCSISPSNRLSADRKKFVMKSMRISTRSCKENSKRWANSSTRPSISSICVSWKKIPYNRRRFCSLRNIA